MCDACTASHSNNLDRLLSLSLITNQSNDRLASLDRWCRLRIEDTPKEDREMKNTYWVEHYNSVTGQWLPVSKRGSEVGAQQLAQAQLGSFNSGTRVRQQKGRQSKVVAEFY